MAPITAFARACPICTAPLVHLELGGDLHLRSCSRCDTRWWLRGDEPADLEEVLDAVAETGRGRRVPEAV
jgi:Zn-finger nucleic acid-binding protein